MCKVAWITTVVLALSSFCLSSPPGGYPRPPRANAEAEKKLKEAYAAYVQGQYQKAIRLSLEVYEKYGDVEAKWFPSWVRRVVKGHLPDPYNKSEVLGRTIEGGFLFTMAIRSTFPSYLLARCYNALDDREETAKWAAELRKWVYGDEIMLVFSLPYPSGYVKPSAPKNTWRPLPLKFREEDYFILVPLDEACKILGLSCTITTNPKMAGGKGIRIVKPDAPNIVYRLFLGRPLVERLENGKGQTETLAYAPYEENGVVWVPFYWLAKQAGIRWWEVRDGKIYVAPKQGTK